MPQCFEHPIQFIPLHSMIWLKFWKVYQPHSPTVSTKTMPSPPLLPSTESIALLSIGPPREECGCDIRHSHGCDNEGHGWGNDRKPYPPCCIVISMTTVPSIVDKSSANLMQLPTLPHLTWPSPHDHYSCGFWSLDEARYFYGFSFLQPYFHICSRYLSSSLFIHILNN